MRWQQLVCFVPKKGPSQTLHTQGQGRTRQGQGGIHGLGPVKNEDPCKLRDSENSSEQGHTTVIRHRDKVFRQTGEYVLDADPSCQS